MTKYKIITIRFAVDEEIYNPWKIAEEIAAELDDINEVKGIIEVRENKPSPCDEYIIANLET